MAFDLFDAELDQAVRAFQQHRGLLVNGIVGEATYRALKDPLPARRPHAVPPIRSAAVRRRRGHPAARLQDLGFYTGLVDGYFGLQTHNALMSYQREYGLSPTVSAVRKRCAPCTF